MRVALWSFILVAALASAAMASSAFNYASAKRDISIAIVGDAAAYLRIEARTGPHSCFVDVANGQLSISFDSASACTGGGAGTGINAGDGTTTARYSRYAFHDILQITNKAPTALHLWVNSSSTTAETAQSAVETAIETTTGQMIDDDYGTLRTLAASSFPAGATVYLGVRVKSGTLSGGALSGSIQVDARE